MSTQQGSSVHHEPTPGAESRIVQQEVTNGLQEHLVVTAEAREAQERAKTAIAADFATVEGLQEAGVTDESGSKRIHDLVAQVDADTAAFETRSDRLQQPYVISPQLTKEHKTARFLKKPHLLEGEPGTGKTSLAYAIAGNEGLPLIHCRGKSTLTAQSVMYEVDYVGRLNDAMLAQNIPDVLRGQTQQWVQYLEKGGDPNDSGFQSFMAGFEQSAKLLNLDKVSDIRKYIQYGELGEAIMRGASGEKVVLLFDEIDKAKREFPNDLLDELEHLTIRIRETGEEISAPRENVVVMITSNHERDLPEPFLRRAVYSYIEFPDAEQMTEIVRAHVPHVGQRLLETAIQRFYEIRGRGDLQKKPSTSEMLDWIQVLQEFGTDDVSDDTPFAETLLKVKGDLDKLGVRGRKESRLQQAGLPEGIIAALHGDQVIRLKGQGNPDPVILVALANAGYTFTMSSYGNSPGEFKPFTIIAPGVRNVGGLTFSIPRTEEVEEGKTVNPTNLYDLFDRKGAIESRMVVTDDPITFVSISESNEHYLKGIDEEGRVVYRMHDRKFVYEEPILETLIEDETTPRGSRPPFGRPGGGPRPPFGDRSSSGPRPPFGSGGLTFTPEDFKK